MKSGAKLRSSNDLDRARPSFDKARVTKAVVSCRSHLNASRRRRCGSASYRNDEMIHRLILFLMLLPAAAGARAEMVRVVAIENGRTITIDRAGRPERIKLAGVVITDELAARELLRWTVAARWVMLEKREGGGYVVWRSPDALFINRELVVRGYARATMPGIAPETSLAVTFLGVINPSEPQAARSGASERGRSPTQRPPARRSRGSASKKK